MTMTGQGQEAWERDYIQRGRRFGGSPPDLPSLPHGSIVLEAGCGDGKTLSAMGRRSWEVLALDFSSEAVRICTRAPYFKGMTGIIADLTALPLCNHSCDGVFLSHVIGHAREKERKKIASETIRVLKPGAWLFFREFSRFDFRSGSGSLTEEGTRLRGDGICTHYFTAPEVTTLFSDLSCHTISEEVWSQKTRGGSVPRAEIVARFQKKISPNDGVEPGMSQQS
ncbi:MAG: class I SAM-dependent methyltransferase [Methanoregulaceae archaeon]|nr:class I SAM-dependent methyltransferase [Methanoregulaceae archaeon]